MGSHDFAGFCIAAVLFALLTLLIKVERQNKL